MFNNTLYKDTFQEYNVDEKDMIESRLNMQRDMYTHIKFYNMKKEFIENYSRISKEFEDDEYILEDTKIDEISIDF